MRRVLSLMIGVLNASHMGISAPAPAGGGCGTSDLKTVHRRREAVNWSGASVTWLTYRR